MITNGTILLLFIAMCLHHRAFYKMYAHSLRELDHVDEKRNDRIVLCELIEFHGMAKRYVRLHI